MTRIQRRRIRMAERKEQKKTRLKAHAELRRKQVIEGLSGTRRITVDNAKCEYMTHDKEIEARQEMAKDYLKVLQRSLPGLLIFLENMRLFFPKLESLPHHDTVNRFLCMIDINQLEDVLVWIIKDFIRSKKF